jgi:hypothetical protein
MRHPAKFLLTGAAVCLAVSCSNDSLAPHSGAPPVISRTNPALAALAVPSTIDFVIPAQGGTVSLLGMYKLSFPANAVCDPNAQDSRDGYAAAAWDSPCTLLSSDITVHATLKWSHDRLWIDFSPSLRFSPSADVELYSDVMAPVVQYYSNNGQDGSGGLSNLWGIAFAPAIDLAPLNDAANDPSIRSSVDFTTGRISRRVKHFTGYNIYTGEYGCTVSPDDPYCIDVPAGDEH